MIDLGMLVVQHVFRNMKIDKEWSVWDQRGFTWWGKDFAQHVWAEPHFGDAGFQITRLHARTDLLQRVGLLPKNIAFLNGINVHASMSGLVFDPDDPTRVQLAASVYVHDQNVESVTGLFTLAVAIQAADAQVKAHGLAELMKVQPASSAHPSSGPRHDMDDMMNVLAGCVEPMGKEESRWVGEDFKETLMMLQQPPCVLATGGDGSLTAEFPFQGLTSLLQVTTDADHPQLGHGVLFRLTLPSNFSSWEEADTLALALNQSELRCLTRAHFLGSWCDGSPDNPALTYVSFFPNAAYQPGLLPSLVMSTMQRAQWVAEEV